MKSQLKRTRWNSAPAADDEVASAVWRLAAVHGGAGFLGAPPAIGHAYQSHLCDPGASHDSF